MMMEMAEPACILVVDDDERIQRVLKRYLEREGYRVVTAANGAEMRRRLETETPALIILDLLLPNESGFELTAELRRYSTIPIIMLTGKTDVVDKVVGLEVGADDYITKPFEERELLARIRNIIRRTRHADARPPNSPASKGSEGLFAGLRLGLAAHELPAGSGQ